MKCDSTIHRSGCWTDKSTSILDALKDMNVTPSGKRSAHSIAARASTGVQTARRAIPQLIPDGMTPAEHVHVALNVCHPMQLQPTLFPPVGYATRYGSLCDEVCFKQRNKMLALVHELSKCLITARDTMLKQCNPVEGNPDTK